MAEIIIDGGLVGESNAIHTGRLIAYDEDTYFAIARDSSGVWLYKSVDGGLTWGGTPHLQLMPANQVQFSVYYERWFDPAADPILWCFGHDDAGSRGLWYSKTNLETDAHSEAQVVSTLAAPNINGGGILVAESGRVWLWDGKDTFANAGLQYSDDAGSSWSGFAQEVHETVREDWCVGWPNPGASDPDDGIIFYWDWSSGEISVKKINAAAGTVTEPTIIATSMTANTGDSNLSVSLSPTTSLFRLAAINAASPTTIRTFEIDGATGTATEKTPVIENTANVRNVALSIDPERDWTIAYYERDGALYYKISQDEMESWSPEVQFSSNGGYTVGAIAADPVPRSESFPTALTWLATNQNLYTEAPILAAELVQYRLMLALPESPTYPSINITPENIGKKGETLIKVERGRDSAVIGNPARAGHAQFRITNAGLPYNLEDPASGRAIRLNKFIDGEPYAMFTGFLQDPVHTDEGHRPVISLSAIGPLSRLANKRISTALYKNITTGEAIGHLLDEAEFPEQMRELADGDVELRYWWVNNNDALSELWKLVNSEGITADLYEDGEGKLVFRDRSARYDDTRSNTIQTTFRTSGTEPLFTGFEYTTGRREIINYAEHERIARSDGVSPEVVWDDEDRVYILGPNEEMVLEAVTSEPFEGGTFVAGTDYVIGLGSATVTLERTSGQRTKITVVAGSGGVMIGSFQLRGTLTTVGATFTEISRINADDSILLYGLSPSTIEMSKELEWDVMRDNLDAIVSWKKDRRGRVKIGLNAKRGTAANEATAFREIGDRIRIIDPEHDFDGELWIERIEHLVDAPAGEAEGPSVGREFTWYECSIISVAVGSTGTGLGEDNPYDSINNSANVLEGATSPDDDHGIPTRGASVL